MADTLDLGSNGIAVQVQVLLSAPRHGIRRSHGFFWRCSRMKSRFRQAKPLLVLICIAGFYGLLNLVGIYCPIRFLTGISCPGCGMTRAWLSVLHGDFTQTMSFHPLFWTMIPAVFAVFFRKKLSRRMFYGLVWCWILLMVAVYLVRLFLIDNVIVVFEPWNGAVIRMIRSMFF